jgi:hypothetical protein
MQHDMSDDLKPSGARIVAAPALDPSRMLGFRLGESNAVTGSKVGDKEGAKIVSRDR